ncbi:peptidoglycan DD-metalloendopeptidase family protein [Dyadobacter arcticus]|uniref:Murein DD-endopeptidase MepM/ murein hydrolase activator NlpD n=1 Tax=Dyadobacter arcticus TaxID=1078754 RepID=A0ABX0USR1_9BACT|nr:peptidoglycan DD-metalloendopeptidase family protein [Dyadobacter arcticus]NIJ55999.1 murein DD-endopeptidase MepM/ murein hydrolase activator NlpD [Dyadobacter arcticus]
MTELAQILLAYPRFEPIIRNVKPFRKLDFTENNSDLIRHDLSETCDFSNYVFGRMLSGNTYIGIGGYNENRVIYRQRKHFELDSENPRSIHLGTDIWEEAGEAIYSPIAGSVHSFAFNNHYGDYGPTIILRHELKGIAFFTLYGHLSATSLDALHIGKKIEAGEKFALIGPFPENGDWPPHLHFQVISDMGTYSGDFPGVSSVRNSEYYLSICPDPNLILRVSENQ